MIRCGRLIQPFNKRIKQIRLFDDKMNDALVRFQQIEQVAAALRRDWVSAEVDGVDAEVRAQGAGEGDDAAVVEAVAAQVERLEGLALLDERDEGEEALGADVVVREPEVGDGARGGLAQGLVEKTVGAHAGSGAGIFVDFEEVHFFFFLCS